MTCRLGETFWSRRICKCSVLRGHKPSAHFFLVIKVYTLWGFSYRGN